eukprot:TRINITY_DN29625_c0_g1_i1.p1 TRINITY_DN29625_c0_g1~~TRINITY_DN29625_c0_g1_i1.p1  ORF type:complete len:978 (+),score=182.42 TRINITY_DN29625_c0_g1_i1:45-2978(+)
MSTSADTRSRSREPSTAPSASGPAASGAGRSREPSAAPSAGPSSSAVPQAAGSTEPSAPAGARDAGRSSLPPSPSVSASADTFWPERRPLAARATAAVKWKDGDSVCARWPPATGPLRHGHVVAARQDDTVDVLWTSGRRTKGLPGVLLEHWDEAEGDEYAHAAAAAEQEEQRQAERELSALQQREAAAAAEDELTRREMEVAAREGDLKRWAQHWGLAPVPPGVVDEGNNYRRRLVRFYSKYNPGQLVMVDDMLKAAAGEEEKLFRALTHMYGPEPAAPEPRDQDPARLRQRLAAFYRWHTVQVPDATITRLSLEYADRPEELMAALVAKHGPEPPQEALAPPPRSAAELVVRLQRENTETVRRQKRIGIRSVAERATAAVRRRYYYRWLEVLWWKKSHTVVSRLVDEGRSHILKEQFVRKDLLDQLAVLKGQINAFDHQESPPPAGRQSALSLSPHRQLSTGGPSTAPFGRGPSTVPFRGLSVSRPCGAAPAGPFSELGAAPYLRDSQYLPEGVAAAAAASHPSAVCGRHAEAAHEGPVQPQAEQPAEPPPAPTNRRPDPAAPAHARMHDAPPTSRPSPQPDQHGLVWSPGKATDGLGAEVAHLHLHYPRALSEDATRQPTTEASRGAPQRLLTPAHYQPAPAVAAVQTEARPSRRSSGVSASSDDVTATFAVFAPERSPARAPGPPPAPPTSCQESQTMCPPPSIPHPASQPTPPIPHPAPQAPGPAPPCPAPQAPSPGPQQPFSTTAPGPQPPSHVCTHQHPPPADVPVASLPAPHVVPVVWAAGPPPMHHEGGWPLHPAGAHRAQLPVVPMLAHEAPSTFRAAGRPQAGWPAPEASWPETGWPAVSSGAHSSDGVTPSYASATSFQDEGASEPPLPWPPPRGKRDSDRPQRRREVHVHHYYDGDHGAAGVPRQPRSRSRRRRSKRRSEESPRSAYAAQSNAEEAALLQQLAAEVDALRLESAALGGAHWRMG